jgi:PQQ-dependent catabolism-associated CXXCW motif protein
MTEGRWPGKKERRPSAGRRSQEGCSAAGGPVGRSDGSRVFSFSGVITASLHHLITACAALLCFSLAYSADPSYAPEPEGFWSGPIDSAVPATIRGGKVIHADDVEMLLKKQNAVIVDVSSTPKRPEGMALDAPWLPLPHESIPGTVWIPEVGMAELSDRLDEFFQAQLVDITGNDLDRVLIVYCHERCWLSWNAAKRAIGYGYRNVHWFPEGVEGWRASGRPTAVVKPRLPPEN